MQAPEIKRALEAARELDQLCADADIQVVLHVVPQDGGRFPARDPEQGPQDPFAISQRSDGAYSLSLDVPRTADVRRGYDAMVVRARDLGIIGEPAVDFIRHFKVDIGLIGISGIEADGSLRDFDYREVKVAQTIIECSREVWLAADHSKFNRPAMVQLATLEQVDRLFTDQAPPEPFPALLKDANVQCVVAQTLA